MKQYKVQPINRYVSYPVDWVRASSSLNALKRYLNKYSISYATSMENKVENRGYFNKAAGHFVSGMELVSMLHFCVDPEGGATSAGKMYALDFPGYPGEK